ncbi:MAG: GNAT family N-acetyltransferase, partial [Chloroflexi bacterium]|nr:GNAT family N-acetyltransferase [Chloroflexota bacterium]
ADWHWVDGGDWEKGFDTFLRLHKLSDPEKEAFMDQAMEGFFRAVTGAALEKGWLRLSLLHFDGQPVASYLCFDYGQDRLVYNSGFDLSLYAELSPGIVLLGHLIGDAIQQGLRRFDFLQGNERYKYDLGATDSQVLRLFIRRQAG